MQTVLTLVSTGQDNTQHTTLDIEYINQFGCHLGNAIKLIIDKLYFALFFQSSIKCCSHPNITSLSALTAEQPSQTQSL